jgi:hypothetical protein
LGAASGVILGYGINHELSATGEHGGKELLTRENFGGFALAPEGRWTGETSFHQFQVTEDEFTEIVTKGTRTFFVYGYIRYADLFGIVRQTGFSYATTFDGGGNFYLVIEATNRALWYDREEPDNAKS